MAMPSDFPTSPYAVLHPDCRWTPGDDPHVDGVPVGNLLPPLQGDRQGGMYSAMIL